MATLELCYYKNGQRICPPSQPVGAAAADTTVQQADSSDSSAKAPGRTKVKKKAEEMLQQYLPDPPEGWTMTYIP